MSDFEENKLNTAPRKKILKKKKRPLKKVPKKSHSAPKPSANYEESHYDNHEANVPAFANDTPVASPFEEQSSITSPSYDNAPQNQYQDNFARDLNLPPSIISTKVMVLLFVLLFVIGLFIGKVMFAGTSVQQGLQGVISNPEVPNGRPRCGLAEKTQGCVLYIMNPERQELEAREFYDLVSQLTGRQKFVIETGNMRYAGTRIKPGRIGQFNIPPLQ